MWFLHTADWQIGMKAAGAGAAGARIRAARLASAERLVEHTADFLLVAGDTFEDNAVDRALVQKTGDILSRFRGPVFLLPGNHDPLAPQSVWEHPVWKQHANLTVIREAGAFAVPGGTLLAAPLRETHSRFDPTVWMADHTRPEGIVIGMSHGTVEGIDPDTEHHPIAREAWKRARVDYLALGHWHSTCFYLDEAKTVRMAYSGTHETTKFGERDSGQALRVTIGNSVSVEQVPTGSLRWETWAERVVAPGDLTRLRNRVVELPQATLLRLSISGNLHAAELSILSHIHDICRNLTFASVDCAELLPAVEGEGWLETLPQGAVRLAARKLCEQAANGDRTAAAALMELQALAAQGNG